MDFDTWLDRAWSDHANSAGTVARRIEEQGLALLTQASEVIPLAHLAHHVFGEHLGHWDAGLALLERLRAHPLAEAEAQGAVARYQAALRLAQGSADARPSLAPSDRVRVGALAAADLALHDSARASALLEQAQAEAEVAALGDKDPAVRALAIAGNNIAATLEELPTRDVAQRSTMIRAAQVGRQFWARAGTWLETERADYRLAVCWLAAGDVAQARRHAQVCLEIVREHDDVALEAFFGWEALGRVEAAAGNTTGHAQALEQARAAFARLQESDRGWCQPSLDKLAAAAP